MRVKSTYCAAMSDLRSTARLCVDSKTPRGVFEEATSPSSPANDTDLGSSPSSRWRARSAAMAKHSAAARSRTSRSPRRRAASLASLASRSEASRNRSRSATKHPASNVRRAARESPRQVTASVVAKSASARGVTHA